MTKYIPLTQNISLSMTYFNVFLIEIDDKW